MRATMRLTWLLLSLGFLFDCVSSDSDAGGAVSTGGGVTGMVQPTQMGTTGGDNTGTGTTGGDTTGTVKPVTDPPGTRGTGGDVKDTVATTLNPTPGPTTAQHTTSTPAPTVPDKPSTASSTVKTTVVSHQDSTIKPAVTAPTTTMITPSGPSATQAAHQPVPTGSPASVSTVPNRVSDSTHDSGVSKTTMASPGPEPQQKSTTSSKDSVGEDDAGKVAATTSANPTQATSRTSQPAGGGVLPTATTTTVATTTATTATITNKITTEGKTMAPSAQSTATATLSPATTTTTTTITTTTTTPPTTTPAQPKIFVFPLNGQAKEDEKDLTTLCKRLMENMEVANCTVVWRQHKGKKDIDGVEISGKVNNSIVKHYFAEITKKSGDNTTLIAILASCGALLAMIIGLAIYASHHRKPYNENQQHLTEELHTVENGYHDNPTLEVMEVQPEMQEKKVALNGEFNDSWIVPIDNLLKEEIPDEEDTHL